MRKNSNSRSEQDPVRPRYRCLDLIEDGVEAHVRNSRGKRPRKGLKLTNGASVGRLVLSRGIGDGITTVASSLEGVVAVEANDAKGSQRRDEENRGGKEGGRAHSPSQCPTS